ncbi:MAG: 2-C-methyl-D-erythritol 4-phosphate cytidylyltransferase [bacterium]|nr:2-C-methyl-D-erythritol 4-phosphate cytidylyltransferase [bacterium]
MKKYALIVAGGKGLRMGTEIPKQFLELNGLPVLMHTLKAFRQIEGIHLILVLPALHFAFWKDLCARHHFDLPHQLVAGGDTRFESVKNGLSQIEDTDSLVAIHDGVRPLVSEKIIEDCYAIALQKGNGIAVVPSKDSIRKQELLNNHSVNRANYYLVQTPQCFQTKLIQAAYQTTFEDNFTDDASVLEATGVEINMMTGDYRNIKITAQEDLIVAEALLKN